MVNTNRLTWELTGTVTWVYTNTLTWELNRYGRRRRTRPDRTHFKSFNTLQADRGFARSQLCTDEDGTTNNLGLYMVRNDTSKKGGDAPRATD